MIDLGPCNSTRILLTSIFFSGNLLYFPINLSSVVDKTEVPIIEVLHFHKEVHIYIVLDHI